MKIIKAGDKFEMAWPFKKYESLQPKDNGFYWCSGCFIHSEYDGGYGFNNTFYCNAEGKIIYKVIKVVKMPKPYLDRVFFQKKLIDPSGKTNRATTECMTINLFNKHINQHTPFRADYEIDETVKEDYKEGNQF
jgi:hypothetical protein